MLESDYTHATSPKPPPPIPVRVSRRSQLMAALRQHTRPIVIEDQELARPFARLLRARQLRLWALGDFVADTMSYAIGRSYGANIEAHWHMGRYVLPGNVEKVILKPKKSTAGNVARERPDGSTFIDTAEGRTEHLVSGTTVGPVVHEGMNHADDRETRPRGGVGDRRPATFGVPAQDLVGEAQASHGVRPRGELHAPGCHVEDAVPPAGSSTSGLSLPTSIPVVLIVSIVF
jgi:hypothetical protein